jgi:hypothetical protein
VSLSKGQRRKVGGGAVIVLVLMLPLWAELRVPGQTVWNVVLFLMLAGLFLGTIFLHRYLLKNLDQVGEARFDTRNK